MDLWARGDEAGGRASVSGQHPASDETHLADRQKAIARRWYEDVIIDRTLDAIDQIYPSDR